MRYQIARESKANSIKTNPIGSDEDEHDQMIMNLGIGTCWRRPERSWKSCSSGLPSAIDKIDQRSLSPLSFFFSSFITEDSDSCGDFTQTLKNRRSDHGTAARDPDRYDVGFDSVVFFLYL